MSDHYNQPGYQQEMDLTDIFTLMGRFFKNVVRSFFKIIDFILKMWRVILLLIVAGVTVGFFIEAEPAYEANLLLKTNFKSQNYVYTAIEQFNDKLEEDNYSFYESLGVSPEKFSLKKVRVDPVVDVFQMISNIGMNEGILPEMTKEFKLEDDRELFATDRFLSVLRYHKLSITLDSDENLQDVNALLSFINETPYAKELKKEGIKNHNDYLKSQEKSLVQLNTLIESYSERNNFSDDTSNKDFYFNSTNDDIGALFSAKNLLIEMIEANRNENLSFVNVAVIMSDIQASREDSLLRYLMIITPLSFIFIFLVFAGFVSAYKSYKKDSNVV